MVSCIVSCTSKSLQYKISLRDGSVLCIHNALAIDSLNCNGYLISSIDSEMRKGQMEKGEKQSFKFSVLISKCVISAAVTKLRLHLNLNHLLSFCAVVLHLKKERFTSALQIPSEHSAYILAFLSLLQSLLWK